MDTGDSLRVHRKDLRRRLLRAANGAGIGLVLGGLIGAGLGVGFAALVFGPYSLAAGMGAMYGMPPGMFGGMLIGTTTVVRDGRRGMIAGTAMGAAVGVLYAVMLGCFSFSSPQITGSVIANGVIGGSVIASGVIGGFALSILIRAIRARWSWWTRWEREDGE